MSDDIEELVASTQGGFRAIGGRSSSFKSKLYKATKHGELANLRDNSEAIMEVVKKRQQLIKRGRYDRLARRKDLSKISASGNVTKEDKREIKELLGALADRESLLEDSHTVQPQRELPEVLQNRHIESEEHARNLPYNPDEHFGGSGGAIEALMSQLTVAISYLRALVYRGW